MFGYDYVFWAHFDNCNEHAIHNTSSCFNDETVHAMASVYGFLGMCSANFSVAVNYAVNFCGIHLLHLRVRVHIVHAFEKTMIN